MQGSNPTGIGAAMEALAAQQRALAKSETRAFRLAWYCLAVAGVVATNVVLGDSEAFEAFRSSSSVKSALLVLAAGFLVAAVSFAAFLRPRGIFVRDGDSSEFEFAYPDPDEVMDVFDKVPDGMPREAQRRLFLYMRDGAKRTKSELRRIERCLVGMVFGLVVETVAVAFLAKDFYTQ